MSLDLELARFNAALSHSLSRGVPLDHSLALASGQAQEARFRAAVDAVLAKVREGATFEEALRAKPSAFPETYAALVGVGEKSRQLPEVLDRAQAWFHVRAQARRGLMRIAVYLAGTLAVCIGVMVALSAAARHFMLLYAGAMVQLPLPTQIVLWFGSHWLATVGFILAAAGAAFALWGVMRWFGRSTGVAYLIPAWGRIERSEMLAHACATLAMRLRADAPLHEAVASAAQVTRNRKARARLLGLARRVAEGEAFSTAIFYDRFFPRAMAFAVSIAEKRGDLPSALAELARIYAIEMERGYRLMLDILSPMSVLAVANVVLIFAFALMMPLMRLQGV